MEGEQGERDELGGEGLGGGDADLRPGVGEQGARGLAREHRALHVADGDGQGAPRACASRKAARVSAVSPLWLMATARVSGPTMGVR